MNSQTKWQGTAVPELAAVAAVLRSRPAGDLPADAVARVEVALCAAWDDLAGTADGGMQGYKLLGRTEGMSWAPPVLSFKIERHGGTVAGSIYAELQAWSVDLSTGLASMAPAGRRQVGRRDQPLDVKALAAELAGKIARREHDSRIKWIGAAAKVVASDLIPQTNRQTTAARRRRFAEELQLLLGKQGWTSKGTRLVFERSANPANPAADEVES